MKMANHLHHLLKHWFDKKDELDWVLATIFDTEGSSYRKSGAMMMINSFGQYHGLLSGGCLESDIMRQARRCWDSGQSRIVQYDMREEEDLAWQLGIGCGGLVKILLQPVDQANQYLLLDNLLGALDENRESYYLQLIQEGHPQNIYTEEKQGDHVFPLTKATNDQTWLVNRITPPYHLAIFGAGIDAKPVVSMAATLGWQITLLDSRSAYARKSEFAEATRIITIPVEQCEGQRWLQTLDACVVMNHNVDMDAASLNVIKDSSAKVVGLLGPIHRTERVFERAQLTREVFPILLSNPMGLRLGGELPESIALSIISEIHAYLEGKDGRSISGIVQ